MALNLGLENLQKVEDNADVTLSDVLASQIDFQEAYQAFTDYRNVCEIVVKAKASTESMAFASELLNASVENIQVSVETLGEKLSNAWDKFIEFWKNAFKWVKNALKKFANVFLKKADGTFKLTPALDNDELSSICTFVDNAVRGVKQGNYKEVKTNVHAMKVSAKKGATGGQGDSDNPTVITTRAQLKEWCTSAAKTCKRIDDGVKEVEGLYNAASKKANDPDYKNTAGASQNTMRCAKVLMRMGPKVINAINKTVGQVKVPGKFDLEK